MAGTASSLTGFVQNSVAALCGISAAWFIDLEPNALAWFVGAIGLINLSLSLAYKRLGYKKSGL